ncbi:MAG: hypothetical protein F6J95_031705 [Leptolyngbya sp. SIO1E4]|nr:hypothetical protein [Leptolyngbya sp. SIO1E4]
MATLTASSPQTDLTRIAKTTLKITDVLGVAIFDVNGLPREYFITEENPSTGWVQIVFQALGLRSLLASSLELEGFQRIAIRLEETTIMVVRRRHDYIALQIKGMLVLDQKADSDRFMGMINALDPAKLKDHDHFKVA